MGAKLTKQPIEDFNSIAGTWKGKGHWGEASFPLTLTVNQDGMYQEDTGQCEGKGKMRIVDGTIRYQTCLDGNNVIITYYEGNGKHTLKGVSDFSSWKVKPAKKKRKKKKKKKNQTSEKKEY